MILGVLPVETAPYLERACLRLYCPWNGLHDPDQNPADPCGMLSGRLPRMRAAFAGADAAPVVSRSSAERSEEHTSELQSRENLVCRLLLEKKKKNIFKLFYYKKKIKKK